MKPVPAVILLTFITSFGSLGAYLLSRPLAPLIGLIFPKPLAMVRFALNGSSSTKQSIDMDPLNTYQSSLPLPQERPTVWRRLLIMRAMGVVPWSGMNVACGVVGVNWMTFVATTAVGSASWSYVTANVGDILAQLALPKDTAIDGFDQQATMASGVNDINGGQSLSGLLRDPALVGKLVLLSLLSLLPVLFKSKADPTMAPPPQSLGLDVPNISQEEQAITPLAPTPSFYFMMASLRQLSRKTFKTMDLIWRSGLTSVISMTSTPANDPMHGRNRRSST